MSEAIFSVYYLPSISYFTEMVSVEKMLFEKHDNFQKATFRNRTIINTANGSQLLSIPIVGGRDKHQLYREVKISYAENWQKQHWQSIRSAYGSAPFFEHYADYIAPFYEKKVDALFDFNVLLLEKIFHLLKVKQPLNFTAEFQHTYDGVADFRDKNAEKNIPTYIQVFSHKNGFNPNVSILDLLFCEGSNAVNYLKLH